MRLIETAGPRPPTSSPRETGPPPLVQPLDTEQVVSQYLPLVRRLCARFYHSGEPMEDLVQVGTIGLIKAIRRYDPDKGTIFPAFAIPSILGEIKNYFRDHGWAVKIPRKIQSQKLAVRKAVEVLTQELGKSPTIPEIGRATGFTEDEVYDTFQVDSYGKSLSLEAQYGSPDGQNGLSLLDLIGTEDPNFNAVTERLDVTQAMDSLTDREKAIVSLKFYGGLSQTRIGEILGMSQMHVSRLQRAALGKLKNCLAVQDRPR